MVVSFQWMSGRLWGVSHESFAIGGEQFPMDAQPLVNCFQWKPDYLPITLSKYTNASEIAARRTDTPMDQRLQHLIDCNALGTVAYCLPGKKSPF